MFHAIKTDTSNFERKALVEDIKAFQFLFKHANIYLARKIEQADLRFDFLKYFRVGLENMRMRRNRVYVHIGEVSNGDICVIIAEFFMRIQSVQWSIVSGSYEDRLIIVFRNDGIRKSAGKLAQQAFNAYGSAGGHKSMARAELIKEKLPSFLNIKDEKHLMDWIIELVEKKTESHPVGFKKDLLGIQKK